MMFDAETVQWIAATITQSDRLGNETSSEAAPQDVEALVGAGGSSENTDWNRPELLVGKTLYIADTSLAIGPSDSFVVRGVRYDVEGEPHRWGSMGIEVNLTRAGELP